MRKQLILAVVVLCCAHSVFASSMYNITEVRMYAGLGLNDIGQVACWTAGTSVFDGRAVVYSNGDITDLGTLGGLGSYGQAINNNGQVTGLSDTALEGQHAFLYTDGLMIDLGSLAAPPNSFSAGYGINDSGQVTGRAAISADDHHAFIYNGGPLIDLGTLSGFSNSVGTGINNLGQVVGYSFTAVADSHAFLYSNGQMSDLGALGGSWSQAFAVNDSGQVTGTAQTPAGEPAVVGHAFLYTNGQMIDLGTLGGPYSQGFGINNSGQVVGAADGSDGRTNAFLYSGGHMFDLNDLVDLSGVGYGKLYSAEAINDRGQILAAACNTPSSCVGLGHILLLTPTATTPVPEPSTLLLLGTALLAMFTLRQAKCPMLLSLKTMCKALELLSAGPRTYGRILTTSVPEKAPPPRVEPQTSTMISLGFR